MIDDGIVMQELDVVWLYLGVMLGLSLLSFIAGIINSYFASFVATNFSYDLRMAILKESEFHFDDAVQVSHVKPDYTSDAGRADD